MGELEEKLNELLSSPEELAKLMGMARSLMGDSGTDGPQAAPSEEMSGGLLKKLGGMLGAQTGTAEKEDGKRALLAAMTPYLGERRRKKMLQAMQLAKLASLAGNFLREDEDNGDGQ